MIRIAMGSSAWRPAIGQTNMACASNIASEPDWRSQREPAGTEETDLLDRTFKWLATLPPELRPIVTGQRHPHVVNRLGDLWPNCECTRLYFQSLLIDRRERRGFPPEVRKELEALQHHYFVHHSGLPKMLWDAVPMRPPRIPRRVFPRHPEGNEIDIPAL